MDSVGKRIQSNVTLLCVLAICVLPWPSGCSKYTNYDDPRGPLSWFVSKGSPLYHGQHIGVVSYNIELGKKLDQIINELQEDSVWLNADIILLQETELAGVMRIAKIRNLNYAYYPSAVHSKRKNAFGNAILSRWPLKDPVKIVLPHLDPIRKQVRIGTAATVIIDNREIRVVSTHTEMYRMGLGSRLDQIDSLVAAIDTSFEYVIVGGDFNTVLHYVLRRFDESFEKIGLIRASEGAGPTTVLDPLGLIKLDLDHIYTKGFIVGGKGVMRYTKASDHHPVWITCRFAG